MVIGPTIVGRKTASARAGHFDVDAAVRLQTGNQCPCRLVTDTFAWLGHRVCSVHALGDNLAFGNASVSHQVVLDGLGATR